MYAHFAYKLFPGLILNFIDVLDMEFPWHDYALIKLG